LDWADVAVRINQQNQKYGATNVCFTGGEPFLQPKGDLERLIKALYKMDYSIEFFTNGTIEFTPWAVHVCQFTMDWKLPGSGEDYKNEVRIENLHKINKVDRENAVKFVVKDLEDFDLALSLYKRYVRDNYPYIIPYAGVAWGHLEPAELWEWNKQAKTPFRLNVQVHNYVFDRTQRGI
jgi:organic radical activating enzyme